MINKNKGFTLIELLAVIIILAVIALIATPIVLNVVDNAKRSAFKNSVNGILDSAKLYQTSLAFESENNQDIDLNLSDAYPEGFDFQGEKPNGGQVIMMKDGSRALAIYNNNYCAIKHFSDNDIQISDYIENECILKKVNLTGTITNTDNLNLKIKLMRKDTLVQEIEPVNNTYQFSNVMLDVYDVVIVEKEEKQYTKQIYHNYRITDDTVLDMNIKLSAGDFNQDNVINNLDRDIVNNCYNKLISTNPSCSIADLNHDGVVNSSDRVLLNGVFSNLTNVIEEGSFTFKGKITYSGPSPLTFTLSQGINKYNIPVDTDGNFILENIPKGSYTLYVGKVYKNNPSSTFYKKWFNIYSDDIVEFNYELFQGNVTDQQEVCDEEENCVTSYDTYNKIDEADIDYIKKYYNNTTTNQWCDLNGDGIIDGLDVAIAKANLGKTGFEE